MDIDAILKRHGLFDVKVPRYTSYPPANRFRADVGRRTQAGRLAAVAPGEAISLYVHIPFCKRLCWFCACRTQGTKTLRPVEQYIDVLIQEISALRAALPSGVVLSRLHLGGGTPTILDAKLMDRLLSAIFARFGTAKDWEFSAEVDPTDAADDVLATMAEMGLNRASVGVQDFAPSIQTAIGRTQSFEMTERVITKLREGGIDSLNIDFLYGLPLQNEETLARTVEQVMSLSPDRLAFYGYAHVPWMSKRQVMIDATLLPSAPERHRMAAMARDMLLEQGFRAIGIDHFALETDSLAVAETEGRLHRNFQGYTDDRAETLIGVGASAISKFREGYSQNAVPTAVYSERVQEGGLAAHKGFILTDRDRLIARMIEDIMCYGVVDADALGADYPALKGEIDGHVAGLLKRYPDVFEGTTRRLELPLDFMCMARVIAASLEGGQTEQSAHSIAI